MILKNMFKKDINRYIKGVIKVGQESEDIVYQELDEYVVTNEILKHIRTFFENYGKSFEMNTDEIGVWISGFFGSGKSHFLKILSYLLSNKEVNEKKATDFFREKIEDELLIADIEKILSYPNETILFNIDAESSADAKSDKEAIVKVFRKMFYKNLGLHGENDEITNFEKYLYKFGKLEEFKEKYQEKIGEEWDEDGRRKYHFKKSMIKDIIAEILEMTEEDKELFDFKSLGEGTSIRTFAEEVKDYIEKQGDNFHLIFLVDEVGQYIGDDNNLILNLQTLSEEFANHCKGKAWIVVTSQEDIDSITKVREKDFSKIQARFKTRLSLSSVSVGEVIQKRILEKTDTANERLKAIFEEKSIALKNAIYFKNASSSYRDYSNSEEFANLYPFIPYQTKLLQKVFEQVRKHGSSGKHLSEGERSMLSAFQEALKTYNDREDNILIPFDIFYDSIETFLASPIRRVIEYAKENINLEDFDIRILKLLFMLKYLNNEMPANLENITTLMIEEIDQDRLDLKNKIEKSLIKLEKQSLIEKNGDNYFFLTDEEQEINKEIQQINIEDSEVTKELNTIIFEEYNLNSKIRYNKYDFSFSRLINNTKYGDPKGELTIEIITSDADNYDENIQMRSSRNQNTLFVKLLNDEKFLNELKYYIKLNKYIKNISISELPETLKKTVELKKLEIPERSKRLKELLEIVIPNSEFYILGNKINPSGSSLKEIFEIALGKLIEVNYTKLNYIEVNYTEKELKEILYNQKISLDITINNEKAIEEVRNYINFIADYNETVNKVINYFSKIPYGWKKEDTLYCLLQLYLSKEIEFKYYKDYFTHNDREFLQKLLNSRENEKIEVKKKEKIDEDLLNKVKLVYSNIFDKQIENDDEDKIAEELKNAINNEISIINNSIDLCERNRYPGIEILEKGLNLYNNIYLKSDNKNLFSSFINVQEDILDWKDESLKVFNFLKEGSNQKNIFESGRKYIKDIENKKVAGVDFKNVQEEIEKLKNIINSSDPFSEIKEIPLLIETIDSFINTKTQKLKEDLKTEFNHKFDEIDELIKSNQDYNNIKEKLMNDIFNEIENYNNIIILKSKYMDWLKKIVNLLKEEIKNKITQKFKEIDELMLEKGLEIRYKSEKEKLMNDIFDELNRYNDISILKSKYIDWLEKIDDLLNEIRNNGKEPLNVVNEDIEKYKINNGEFTIEGNLDELISKIKEYISENSKGKKRIKVKIEIE